MDDRKFLLFGSVLCALSLLVGGCASSSESAGADTLTANVGNYGPPPSGLIRAKVGVPPFQVTEGGEAVGDASTDSLAADQMTTLAVMSQRFEVIERTNLGQLAREQGLEGRVKADEMAKAGQMSGVDYLIFGKVTNLRVKAEKSGTGFNLGSIPIPFVSSSIFDYQNKESTITAECGVDIRMVQPTTAKVVASHFGEFKRTDSISAFGISILGAGATSEADLQIDQDNKGKLLRLALDDAFRKMLPQVDTELVRLGKERAAAAPPVPAPAPPTAVAAPAAAGELKCPACGKAVAAGVKFCGSCGGKMPEPQAQKVCAACGKELVAGTKFCGGCGAKVPE